MQKTNHNKTSIPPALLDALLEHSEGMELFGQEGFFHQLKQSLVNSILAGEMDHHIGYKKYDKSPGQVHNCL